MTAVFGHPPGDMEVNLIRGSDFTAVCSYDVDGVVMDWPVGTELTIIFATGEEFEAVVDGELATFEEDYTVIDTMVNADNVKLRYVNGETHRVFFTGRAKLYG